LGFMFISFGILFFLISLFFLFGQRTRPQIGVPLYIACYIFLFIGAFILTSSNSSAEDIWIHPIIVPKLKLINV
jgi:hypothetical protein